MKSDDDRTIILVMSACTIFMIFIMIVDVHLANTLLRRAKELSRIIQEAENAVAQGPNGDSDSSGVSSFGMVRVTRMVPPIFSVERPDVILPDSHPSEFDGDGRSGDLEIPQVFGEVE